MGDLAKEKDNAYWERNQLVAALSKIFPAHLAKHPKDDESWEDDWRNIVVVYLPIQEVLLDKGEYSRGIPVTWHVHDHEMPLFDHLFCDDMYYWDGHDTQEKYKRLRTLILPKFDDPKKGEADKEAMGKLVKGL